MQITQKGQITIPIALREKYGLLPHSEIEFVEQGGKIFLKKVVEKKHRGSAVIARLRGTASVKMTTDQILSLTRGKK